MISVVHQGQELPDGLNNNERDMMVYNEIVPPETCPLGEKNQNEGNLYVRKCFIKTLNNQILFQEPDELQEPIFW